MSTLFSNKRYQNGSVSSTNSTETVNSPSVGRESPLLTRSSIIGETNKSNMSATSQPIESKPDTESSHVKYDYTSAFASYDVLTNGSATNGHASSTSSKQDSKSIVSGSRLLPSALEYSNKQGGDLAAKVSKEITTDKAEVVNIIANYAIEPSEMLHLVDRWIQQLLSEFQQQRDQFKHRLSDKWQNEELTSLKYENHHQTRKIYTAYRELERARSVTLSHESFNELNNFLRDIDDSETITMKQRFNDIAKDYSNIVQYLQLIDNETGMSNDDYINDIRKTLSKLKQLNNKQSHTICIIGLEKAGKSTFTNALLGYELVPTASERCTQVRTVLKPPPDDSDQSLFATIRFYDDDEFHVLYNKMVKKTDETEDQLNDRRHGVITARDGLKAEFPEKYFRINNRNDIERARTEIGRELNYYITGEVYVNIIKEISIYTDRLPGKNYELLDVPGFDSPIKEHREAGLEAIRTADAFVFLTNGQHPNLTDPQVRLLNEIHQNHFEAMQRAFGVITKLDLCQTPSIYQDHYEKAVNELIEKKFVPEHIFVACPRIEIIDKNSEEYRVINDKIRNFSNDLLNGFERSKEALNKFIEFELPKTHLKQLLELGRMRLRQSVIERLNLIKEKHLIPDDLTGISVDEYIKRQKTESWDGVYDSSVFLPAFQEVNRWHTTVITRERVKFIDDVRQTFYDAFQKLTKPFLNSTEQIEQQMYQAYSYSKLQLNPHPVDNTVRQELSFQLEKIVDDTSNILAKHFYHKYVCGLETIIYNISPYLKDLYRTTLTLEKCTHETHALVLRVCRPIITAILRYSHFDLAAKMNAIIELIYIAPTVACNIAYTADKHGSTGLAGMEILKAIDFLENNHDMTTWMIRKIFSKKN
ncbi:hypothetical protein I4U23_015171 [Adineta vaga]|nr:hypothetical protein I4U23_015171 [Adineta vaga]